MDWKKGRGKLGVFAPLLGNWICESDTERGPVVVTRQFEKTLDGKYIELRVQWKFAKTSYEELALFGVGRDKAIHFWSFTSDGKNSQGILSDAGDINENNLAFEATMDAGVARQVYWPHEREGFHWAVESKTRKGWNRFVDHHYRRA